MLELVKKQIEGFVEDVDEESVAKLFAKVPQGKMLRSKLILQIAPTKEGVFLAAVVEMIHAASLLHDDVIDEANTRRGEASINAIFGNKSAIMLGDILYAKAFYELSTLDKRVAQIISNAVVELSIGELLDVQMAQNFNTDQNRYFAMIYKKTASLIEASAMSAAYIANKDEEAFGLYGKNLGLAFQIVDDILDITQDEKTLGKPAMQDFKEGKTTLPYIYLYERLNEEDKRRLLSLFKKELNSQERAWLYEKFEETKALDDAKKMARELGLEALAVLGDEDSRLKDIMSSLIERTY